MKKRFVLGLVGLVLLVAQFALPAGALTAPSVTISPAAGPPGTAFGVSAAALAPGTDHLVQVVRGAGNVNTVRVFEEVARADARGELHQRLVMDQEPGEYTVRIVAIGGTVLATAPFTLTPGGGPSGERYFPETGQTVRGRFLGYWTAHGLDLGDAGISSRESLALFGFPLSAERREVLEDAQEHTVQYFERVRLELHPENAAPYDVLLGQFGRRVLRAGDDFLPSPPAGPAPPRPGAAHFSETGHNVEGRFLAYWRANGGLAQFGLPLTEAATARLIPDGPEYTVQYFERARFELHPENAPPYDVLLGQFGRRIMAEADLLATAPELARSYLVSERLQGQVGRPAGPATRAPGGYRAFERGAMLWRGDTRQIYVLCGGDRRAGDDVRGPFVDSWREGDAPGGGAGPRPGLYEPGRGFGKLWREDAGVRGCLGYATDPVETAAPIAVQPFRRVTFDNLLIGVGTPEGRVAYAVYGTALGGSACITTPALCRPDYERYPDPAR